MANLLQAIHVAINNHTVDVASFYRNKNRTNAVGDALELFIKDIFANALNETNETKKMIFMNKYFRILVMQITLLT